MWNRMLDMFKRAGDPDEHNYLYGIPTGALLALYGAGYLAGVPEIAAMTYLTSAVASIAAIGCLANQKTARTGNALGMMGVTGGIAATAGLLAPDIAVAGQLLGSLGVGLGTGAFIAQRMKITELPQMVAAFHSLVRLKACCLCPSRSYDSPVTTVRSVSRQPLETRTTPSLFSRQCHCLQVGFAAVSTSVANYMIVSDPATALVAGADAAPHAMDTMHKITAYLGTLIGAVTLTGSAVAFGKLHGMMSSKPLNLPAKNQINIGLAAGSLGAGATFLATGSPALGIAALSTTTATGGALGYHLTASIGGADMPVVITLLNSYSGYALCAEGFMMNNDLLVTVGALIGSSGAGLPLLAVRSDCSKLSTFDSFMLLPLAAASSDHLTVQLH
jgi:H+-translocating NAD(P) transhydrogenase